MCIRDRVWDNKKMYRYRQDKRGIVGAINKLKQYFGIEGYTLVEEHDLSLIHISFILA